ncbi:hypothetical protein BDW74DRAFT_178085 [Aspergillus multicolor]|uniref:uncharacterized protein n=1 Tax=Aspergillus multicolor TaxID=41759 RepID=UPI003CCCDE65
MALLTKPRPRAQQTTSLPLRFLANTCRLTTSTPILRPHQVASSSCANAYSEVAPGLWQMGPDTDSHVSSLSEPPDVNRYAEVAPGLWQMGPDNHLQVPSTSSNGTSNATTPVTGANTDPSDLTIPQPDSSPAISSARAANSFRWEYVKWEESKGRFLPLAKEEMTVAARVREKLNIPLGPNEETREFSAEELAFVAKLYDARSRGKVLDVSGLYT